MSNPVSEHVGCACWGDEDCPGYRRRVTAEVWHLRVHALVYANHWHGKAFPISGEELADIRQLTGNRRRK